MRILAIILPLLLHFSAAISFSDEVPRYDLTIRIVPQKPLLEVQGTIRLPKSNLQQEFLHLALSEVMENFQIEVVEPKTSAGIAAVEKTYRPWRSPGWGTNTWKITPPAPLPPGEEVLLRYSYIDEGEKSSFIYAKASDCFFGSGSGTAWYPQLEETPRTDDGIRLKGFRGTGILRFLLPAGFSVYSPGRRTETYGTISFDISQPVFFSFAAAKYSITRRNGEVPTSLFQLQDRGKGMEDYIAKTEAVLRFLSKEFGPYMHSEFAITEIPSEQANSAGFAGASLEGFMMATTDFLNQKYNTAYYGHEVGHQWWGNALRTEGSEGLWMMSEAMAQYGSVRAVEELDGEAMAELYRRRGYPGYIRDQCGFGYLAIAAAGHDRPLSDLPRDGALPRWLADSKGFLAWDILSREIGRDKFSGTLRSILLRHSGKRLTWKQFLAEISSGADRNLDWFYQQWFYRTGVPDFRMTWHQQSGILKVTILQSEPAFEATLPLLIKGEDGKSQHQSIRVSKSSESFDIKTPFAVTAVELDPHFVVLRWTEEYRKEAEASLHITQQDSNTLRAKRKKPKRLLKRL